MKVKINLNAMVKVLGETWTVSEKMDTRYTFHKYLVLEN
jgi:hypothetical protein